MKLQGKARRTQRLEGTITRADLLELVRGTFIIPDDAIADFSVADTGSRSGLLQAQMGYQPASFVLIGDSNPVRVTITWSLPDVPSEQG